jgi:ribose/xylose/arabinose/galactoside ABC-type transport system permease subunit
MAFAISGFLAALAAIFFIARRDAIDPFMGLFPVLKAFVACVLGGSSAACRARWSAGSCWASSRSC